MVALVDAADAAQPLGRRRIIAGIVVTVIGGVLVALGLFAGTSAAFQLLGLGAFLLYIGVSSLAPGRIAVTVGVGTVLRVAVSVRRVCGRAAAFARSCAPVSRSR